MNKYMICNVCKQNEAYVFDYVLRCKECHLIMKTILSNAKENKNKEIMSCIME